MTRIRATARGRSRPPRKPSSSRRHCPPRCQPAKRKSSSIAGTGRSNTGAKASSPPPRFPPAQSTDFLDIGAIQSAFNAAETAELWSQVNGYPDGGAEVQGALKQVESDLEGQGVCATVKLQIDQTATLTRSAFSGTLTISNSEGTGAMTNLVMNINITDAEAATRPTASSSSPARATAGRSAAWTAVASLPGQQHRIDLRSRSSRMTPRRRCDPTLYTHRRHHRLHRPLRAVTSRSRSSHRPSPSTRRRNLQLNYFLQTGRDRRRPLHAAMSSVRASRPCSDCW